MSSNIGEERFLKYIPFGALYFCLRPKFLEFFSMPIVDRGVTKFFTKTFRDNMEYRQTRNIVEHDFMNLLIQLIEKGYVEPDDLKDIDEPCKYIHLF